MEKSEEDDALIRKQKAKGKTLNSITINDNEDLQDLYNKITGNI